MIPTTKPTQSIQLFLLHPLLVVSVSVVLALLVVSASHAQDGIEPQLLYTVHGDPGGGDFGAAIAGLGDIDRDGVGDFAVTAYWTIHTEAAGRWVDDRRTYVRVFSGRDGLELYTIRSEPFDGPHKGQDRGGVPRSRLGLGDLDGDFVPEFISYMQDQREAVIVSGKAGKIIRSYESESFLVCATLEDLNRDGFKEYYVYDDEERASGFPTSRIHCGRTGETVLRLKWGKDENEPLPLSNSVVSVGDFNGDGLSEIALGARRPVHAVWILSGDVRGEHFLEDLTDTEVLWRHEQTDPGWDVATGFYSLGDLDGDGIGEFASGLRSSSLGVWGLGVFSPGAGEQLWQWAEKPDVKRPFARRFCGSIGDIDGDGVRDLVADSYVYGPYDPSESQIVLFSGKTGAILSREPMATSARLFGIIQGDASTVDDLNSDGILEVAWADDHAGPGRVGLYSYGPGPVSYLGDNYEPRLGFVDDDGQRFVVWPAVVEAPVVETSTDLIEWEALFSADEAPNHNRIPLPEAFKSGTRYFRLRYQPTEQ